MCTSCLVLSHPLTPKFIVSSLQRCMELMRWAFRVYAQLPANQLQVRGKLHSMCGAGVPWWATVCTRRMQHCNLLGRVQGRPRKFQLTAAAVARRRPCRQAIPVNKPQEEDIFTSWRPSAATAARLAGFTGLPGAAAMGAGGSSSGAQDAAEAAAESTAAAGLAWAPDGYLGGAPAAAAPGAWPWGLMGGWWPPYMVPPGGPWGSPACAALSALAAGGTAVGPPGSALQEGAAALAAATAAGQQRPGSAASSAVGSAVGAQGGLGGGSHGRSSGVDVQLRDNPLFQQVGDLTAIACLAV